MVIDSLLHVLSPCTRHIPLMVYCRRASCVGSGYPFSMWKRCRAVMYNLMVVCHRELAESVHKSSEGQWARLEGD